MDYMIFVKKLILNILKITIKKFTKYQHTEKLKLYKNLDYIPIYNVNKILLENDLRFLIIGDITEIEDIKLTSSDISKLKESYKTIISQMPDLDLTMQCLYFNCLYSFFNYISKNGTLQDYNNNFNKYITFLDRNYKNFKFGDKIFPTAKDFHLYLKSVASYEDLLDLRINLFNYKLFIAEPIKNIDLINEVITLRDITNQNIDIFKTSFKEFMLLKKYAIEKMKKNE